MTLSATPPVPANEEQRLGALYEANVLDSAPEEPFDRIVDLAASVFGVPIALVSMIDRRRQWFKAAHGLDVRETPREYAFCAYTIMKDGVCLVPDATSDDRFRANPLVTGTPDIRFYAGAPVYSETGYPIGTLCLIDTMPRADFDSVKHAQLIAMAKIVSDQFKLREKSATLGRLAEAAEQARREAETDTATKSEFLATMSHEIRTPMNGIVGMANLLIEDGLTPTQKEYALILKSAANHLLELINDILDFSKLEAGAVRIRAVPTDLHALLSDVMAIMAPLADEKDIALGATIDPDVPRRVVCDPALMRQILLNLIGNAVKFTSEGGVILDIAVVDASAVDRVGLSFSVRDTGIGIKAADLPRLFNRFSQIDGSLTRRFGGTGLGLAICHRLASLIGGKLTASSELGRGSEFRLEAVFPRDPGSAALEIDRFPENYRVLVAHGNSIAEQILVRNLNALGAEAIAVDLAFDPLEPGALVDIDAVIVDDATAATGIYERAVAGLASGQRAPLLILATRAKRLPAGFSAALRAPLTPQRLFSELAPLLRGPAQNSRNGSTAPETDAQMFVVPMLNILLADDNVINQEVGSAILERMGHQVTVVENGAEAVSAVATGAYDVVLMDVMMPVLDGIAATRAIRNLDAPISDVYVIAVTANAANEDRDKCFAAGMNDHIVKPISAERLESALATCAGIRRLS